jgi:hypothetical protein
MSMQDKQENITGYKKGGVSWILLGSEILEI